MPINVACPQCGKKLTVRDEFAGKAVRCACQQVVEVPAAKVASSAGSGGPIKTQRRFKAKDKADEKTALVARVLIGGGVGVVLFLVLAIVVYVIVSNRTPKERAPNAGVAASPKDWQSSFTAFMDMLKNSGETTKITLIGNPPETVTVPPAEGLRPFFKSTKARGTPGIEGPGVGSVTFTFPKEGRAVGPKVEWEGVFQRIEPKGSNRPPQDVLDNMLIDMVTGNYVIFDLPTELRTREDNASDTRGIAVYSVYFSTEDADVDAWKRLQPGQNVRFTGEISSVKVMSRDNVLKGVPGVQHAVSIRIVHLRPLQ